MIRPLIIVAAIMAFSGAAQAQLLCGKRDEIAARIGDKFGERRQAVGTMGETALVELFVSPAGTWTMLLTRPGGLACILALGRDWMPFIDTKVEGDPA